MIYERFVITGNGRSGTRYASELLTRSGLPCAHQRVYHERSDKPGWLPDWKHYVGDSTAFAAPFVQRFKKTLVIHQVRDPRLSIPSMIYNKHVVGQEGMNPGLAFISRHVSVGGFSDLTERAAVQWTAWNLLVESISDRPNYRRWRLEDVTIDHLLWLAAEVGADIYDELHKEWPKQPKNTGSRGGTKALDLGQIKSPEFHEMVERYGYGG